MEPPIRLMHFSPAWRQEFEQTKSGIFQSCQGDVIAIEHVGSTAIPGLIARPIIDLVAIVAGAEQLETAASQIEGLYFRRVETPAWCSDSIVLTKPRHGEMTHQVYLTYAETRTHRRTMTIRDHLRQVPARAVEFESAKIRRWKDAEGDPELYFRDKAVFFAHLEEQLGI
jgi:GrpB-like predicted nucleotidyltransferase (UPF0157 family)